MKFYIGRGGFKPPFLCLCGYLKKINMKFSIRISIIGGTLAAVTCQGHLPVFFLGYLVVEQAQCPKKLSGHPISGGHVGRIHANPQRKHWTIWHRQRFQHATEF
jgi:hypothetical protein